MHQAEAVAARGADSRRCVAPLPAPHCRAESGSPRRCYLWVRRVGRAPGVRELHGPVRTLGEKGWRLVRLPVTASQEELDIAPYLDFVREAGLNVLSSTRRDPSAHCWRGYPGILRPQVARAIGYSLQFGAHSQNVSRSSQLSKLAIPCSALDLRHRPRLHFTGGLVRRLFGQPTNFGSPSFLFFTSRVCGGAERSALRDIRSLPNLSPRSTSILERDLPLHHDSAALTRHGAWQF